MSYSDEDFDIQFKPEKHSQEIEQVAPAENSHLIEEIDAFAAELAESAANEQENDNQMMSHDMLKAKLKAEYKELFLMKELKKELEDAVALLKEEGRNYLKSDEWERLVSEFKQAAVELKNAPNEDNKTPQELGKISQETMNSIESLAKIKHSEKKPEASALLYTLLSAMNPKNFVYWLRLGVCYQEQNEYKKALFAYENAHRCNAKNVVSQLFTAECLYHLGENEKAAMALEIAKALLATIDTQGKWDEYLATLEKAIATH